MTLRKSFFAVLMVLTAAVGQATASSITYSVVQGAGGPGTFNLTAQVSADTFGLAQYAVKLTGAATIDHNSPVAAFAAGAGSAIGFDFARSPDDINAVVSAGQSVTTAGRTLIYNIGKVAGALADAPNGPLFGVSEPNATGSYGVPVVLATGTYAQSAPPVIGLVDGLVFTNTDRGFQLPSEGFIINQLGPVIPEPATIALSGLAIVGLLGLRRRSA